MLSCVNQTYDTKIISLLYYILIQLYHISILFCTLKGHALVDNYNSDMNSNMRGMNTQ
jgi:TRAP-type mannitol/chloroaromatic compound transport system permease large subunit